MTDEMKYTGVELFMEKLKQMIYNDDNPLVTNHRSILSERPQFLQLYEELDSVIQTLHSIDDEHQQVTDLKRRFKDVAEDAHDVIDLFVCNVNRARASRMKRIKESTVRWVYSPSQQSLSKRKVFLNLEDVMRSIKSIKEEFITIQSKMNMDSSARTDNIKPTSVVVVETSGSKDTLAFGMKKASEDIVVGFDRHVELIRDKLVEDQKKLDVVSIVGMGGQGKTTLATKVFNDPFIKYYFHVRGWVTVSQTYNKKDLLIQILESIGDKIDNTRDYNYSQLRQMLHRKLMRKRYLIVIDDIWNLEAWGALNRSFPNDDVGSRILLTSRLKEVALHANSQGEEVDLRANPQGLIYKLEYLTEEESWELLRKKVFHDSNVCPEWLVEPGMKIAKNCHGLPLTLVVVAGVLAKEPLRKDSWERIGQSVSSYLVNNETESLETLAWSFDHLPGHLRHCYLYLGGFPEDHKFRVQRLIWLWLAEGFIQEDGIRSVEKIAEDHLIELVDRNLVVVTNRKPHGDIKSFYVHDLLRELCFKIAMRENFYLKAQRTTRTVETYKKRRMFIEDNINIMNTPHIRSLLCFDSVDGITKLIKKLSHSWILLMVLDLRGWRLNYFPEEMSQLVHLRYLAISFGEDAKFPTLICKLWNLQTLVIRNDEFSVLELPKAISNLVNLRHLMFEAYFKGYFSGSLDILFPAIEKPMNLQTISRVKLRKGVESWVKCFPGVKKLSCHIQRHKECDLESLTSLEHLKLSRHLDTSILKFTIFPPSLISLTLKMSYLSRSEMSIIHMLPNLEVLKLLKNALEEPKWDVGEDEFCKLKFLKLSELNIKEWEVSSNNFPCLKQLVLEWCFELEEIPSDFGNIPTLELISISDCKESIVESLDTIKEEQHAGGNFELKIITNRLFTPEIWKVSTCRKVKLKCQIRENDHC